MSAVAGQLSFGRRRRAGTVLGAGVLGAYLSVLVLLPIAALLANAAKSGPSAFWSEVSSPEAVAALKLTLVVSAIVVLAGAFAGTLIAWVLVRDEFPGKWVVNALIDLPFALPTVVAGVVLLALYGKGGPTGIDITFTRAAVGLALLFVTLPFVVRSVQPVLQTLDRAAEEAASSLGAGPLTGFRRIVLPALTPAILSGMALSFARAVGEFGSGRPDLWQPPLQDGGRLGLHLQPGRERQRRRSRGCLGDPAGLGTGCPERDDGASAREVQACPLTT